MADATETPLPEPTTEDRARHRFFTAAAAQPPTGQQRVDVATLRDLIVDLAVEIEHRVPDGRNKALALTALEDVQMRANRGIFATGASR